MNRFTKLDIPKMSPLCIRCQNKFLQNMVCNSFLYEGLEGQWIREDECDLCRSKDLHNKKDDQTKQQRFFWKSKVMLSNTKKQNLNLSLIEKILEMFRSALSRESEQSKAQAFILALFLKRKKKFFERGEMKSATGELFALYEDSISQEVFAVPKMNLGLLEVDKIQAQLQEQLRLT